MNAPIDLGSRVFGSVIESSKIILVKLDAWYDSKFTTSKISGTSELTSVHYTSLSDDVSKHICCLSGGTKQPLLTENNLEDSVAIGILISYSKALELGPVTASIKTVSDRGLN